MQVTIYLSNRKMQVLVGTVKGKKLEITQAYNTEISEGCLINGVVTDDVLLLQELHAFWNEYNLPRKNVRLVVDSSQILSYLRVIPKLDAKHTLNLVEQEFQSNEEPRIIDYFPVRGKEAKGTQNLFCAGLPVSLISTYESLFREIGISLTSVNFSLACLIKLIDHLPALHDQTLVWLVFDGDIMHAILIENGIYRYSSRQRLFNAEGTFARNGEIAQNISGIMQFLASNKSENRISNVYVAGCSESTFQSCVDGIGTMGIDTHWLLDYDEIPLVNGNSLRDFPYAVGDFIQPKKDLELFKLYRRSKPGHISSFAKYKKYVPIALVSIAVLGTWFGISQLNRTKSAYLNMILTELESPSLQQQLAREDELQLLNTRLAVERQELQAFQAALQTYPVVTSTLLEQVERCSTEDVVVEFVSFNSETGVLNFNTVAKDLPDIPLYINRLIDSGLFVTVAYSGYSYSETQQNYTVSYTINLKSNEPAEVTE